jgi:hypothetical protein
VWVARDAAREHAPRLAQGGARARGGMDLLLVAEQHMPPTHGRLVQGVAVRVSEALPIGRVRQG